jgi:RNA polymerase sigma-70 factor (ECF subfamily)
MRPDCDHTDADLVTALNDSDKKAFEIIYRNHVGVLFGYARKNIQVKEDCEEIVQEIFESLWARREILRIQAPLRAYLLGMVRYKIIHYFKKKAVIRKYTEHFTLFDAVYSQLEGKDINPETIESTVDKLVSQLPRRCQQAVKLRLSENLSNAEIARRMNIGTRTVETYMLSAFQYFRTHYKVYLDQ